MKQNTRKLVLNANGWIPALCEPNLLLYDLSAPGGIQIRR